MADAYVYDGLRTPIGRHAGALAPVRPDDLLGGVIKELVGRNPFKVEVYEDAIVGCTNQAGEDARNVARHAALLAGLPTNIGGLTVNRLCGSGLAAVADAARAASVGQGDLFVAGGVESMSRAPFVMAKAESAYSREMKVFDSTIGARFPNPRIAKSFGEDTMPQTADNVAHDYEISREASDRFALASQEKYARAKADGFYEAELLAVKIPGAKRGAETVVAQDEHPRPNTTMERLAELKPLFPNGVVTAGNASGVNDGAAALIIGSKAAGEKAGKAPIARLVSAAVAGVEPRVMGLGPVPASKKALARGIEPQGYGRDRAQRSLCQPGTGLPQASRARLRRQPRQSQWRRHRHRPSARRLGRTAGAHCHPPAAAERRALCACHHVYRRRPGHRRDLRARRQRMTARE
jgi:acetyl-CoA C-acetyltransferase